MSRRHPRKTTERGSTAARKPDWAYKVEGAAAGESVAGEPRALQFTLLNWALLAGAAVTLAAGYGALASASPMLSTVVAPILLVGAYVVLIPLGLIL